MRSDSVKTGTSRRLTEVCLMHSDIPRREKKTDDRYCQLL